MKAALAGIAIGWFLISVIVALALLAFELAGLFRMQIGFEYVFVGVLTILLTILFGVAGYLISLALVC